LVKVSLLGQPYWVARLQKVIADNSIHRLRVSALAKPSHRFPKQARDAVCADVLMRVGFRPGACTARGLAFDAFWSALRKLNPRCGVVYYWLGTDVSRAVRAWRNGRVRWSVYHEALRDRHIVDAPWLVDELAELGIDAAFIPIPLVVDNVASPPCMPRDFTVLTYIPDDRPEFYGASSVFEAARHLPSATFHVVGERERGYRASYQICGSTAGKRT